jgi:Glyoxalase/Bleomycin resistance protein/Dioxygenase superfamily
MNTVPLLRGFYQTAYVTADLDAAMRMLAATHGIERFRVKRDVPGLPGMPEMVMHQAHVYIGPIQIELIQPAGGDDGLYRDFCAPDPGAIRYHHVGMWIDNEADYEALPSALAQHDIPVVFSASIPNVGGALYADARPALGHYLEYVHFRPDVKDTYYADVPRY